MVLSDIPYGDEVMIRVTFNGGAWFRISLRHETAGVVREYIAWYSQLVPASLIVAFALLYAAPVTFTYTLAIDYEMADLGLKAWVMDHLGLVVLAA